MGKDTFIIPEAPLPAQPPIAPASGRVIDALRLGILDNSKANADVLLASLADKARASFASLSTSVLRKHSAASPAPPELLDELMRSADFVVSAMAD